MSLEGFTGILNTPNAHVTEEGWVDALYSNQEESKWRKRTPYQDSYQFSLGFLKFIEIGGRFVEAPHAGRDLSASFKLSSAPLTTDYPLLPVIAAGVQDIGGGATLLQTRYLVVSEDIWRLRLSAGYGDGPDRMKGVFAGGELKAHDWLYLLGEYDTEETNVGARVVLPQFWKVPFRFTATVKTSLDHNPGKFDFAVGFSMPLDFKVRGKGQSPASPRKVASTEASGSDTSSRLPGVSAREEGRPSDERRATSGRTPKAEPEAHDERGRLDAERTFASSLRDRLISEGFLNVRVGTVERTLVVEYENTIFNHNELDALGVVTGLACDAAPAGFDTLRVVIKRRDIQVAAVSAPLHDLRSFLENPDGVRELRDHLKVDFESGQTEKVHFVGGDENSGIFNTSLMISPGLTTFIGTEVGAFDYLLSLRPELTTSLWKGAVVTARYDIPISWSENLEDGRLYRGSRHDSRLDRLMLFQAVKPLPSVLLNLGGGMVLHDRYGVLNEAMWSPMGGEHRFRVAQAWTRDDASNHKSDVWLGSYRYYFSPLDLSLEGTAGKFWAEDKGFSFEMKRFWEDTAISFYYKNTKGTDHKRWQAVGIQLAFPLTPRRDMKPIAKLQLRGADEWAYAQESTLKNNNVNSSRGSLNYLAPYPLAINPQPSPALYRSFYNRDRLSAAYIRTHLDRLREAWLKYGGK